MSLETLAFERFRLWLAGEIAAGHMDQNIARRWIRAIEPEPEVHVWSDETWDALVGGRPVEIKHDTASPEQGP